MSVMDKIFGVRNQNTDPKLLASQIQAAAQSGIANPVAQVNPVQQTTNNLTTNPAPGGTQQTAQTSANGLIPADGNKPADASPLAPHKDLWNDAPIDPNKPKPQTSTPIDNAQLLEAAKKVDFSTNFSAEELAKVLKGGEEGMVALGGLLNKAAQAGSAQAIVSANKLAEHVVSAKAKDFNSLLPGMVKTQQINEALLLANPAFANPAIAPLVQNVKSQFEKKFPDASVTEIVQMTGDFLANTSGAFNPGMTFQKTVAPTAKPDEIDWDAYLKQDSNNPSS